MSLKVLVKRILSPISKVRYNIKHSEGHIYIGKGCKLVNACKMLFGKNVSIMPYSMLVCHGTNSSISLGEGVEIGMFSRVAAKSIIVIEENVFTGPHVFIADYNHEYRDVSRAIKHQGDFQKKRMNFLEVVYVLEKIHG